MKNQYGDSCLSQERVYEWVERFQNRRQNVSDKHRSGRPVSVATETLKQQIEQRIRDYIIYVYYHSSRLPLYIHA